MTDQYDGPNVYRVYDIHPAVSIEFSGEELDTLLKFISIGRSSMFYNQGTGAPSAEQETVTDILDRVYRAQTAMRAKFYDTKGERKVRET